MDGVPAAKPRLMDRVRSRIRYLHYSLSTERAYLHWIRRYIYYHDKRHHREMGKLEIESFLNYLTRECRVSASTQNQALNAIIFLYQKVLEVDVGIFEGLLRPRLPGCGQ